MEKAAYFLEFEKKVKLQKGLINLQTFVWCGVVQEVVKREH
jgi:hypothetical protein